MALLPAGSAPVTLKPELLIAPMVFEPVGSAPAIEPTKTRPLESSCTAPICPLVKVGSVVLNAPPVSVAAVGAVAPVDPTEALSPPLHSPAAQESGCPDPYVPARRAGSAPPETSTAPSRAAECWLPARNPPSQNESSRRPALPLGRGRCKPHTRRRADPLRALARD